ncbi:MAG: 3-deoxy-D-manno-octulosonate 8-phosphate phosphatase [Candidatus Muiribacterium halophilum]|uniref:3-deoxy-D-manno-octulosonate 8-phosphate phosphatase n=1 Tax=Muiribacterium halophilum TaxID=2053465 RepID=A0A2N5Z931_MUIH1|nr:MAG: 3-deoxy-D-manno-octulosonate 8-phosphate phosphatase [Candidatus Muirbacterium halophilum]
MIRLVILDVDGTLTDGGIYYSEEGVEIKRFNVKDGLGIICGMKHGLRFAIITGRKSNIVMRRASELGITDIYQGVHNKVESLMSIIAKYRVNPDEVAYVGDDLNDLSVMEKIAMPMCPSDAVEEVKKISKFISKRKGGEGAVRECVEHVLRQNGSFEKALRKFR